ncbi:hypothetical protein QBC46DRAFT_379597 [Diplogelasinospora grovesii]|uniref:Uncharacterized protein n=1 Tax=Diplogelasinospora grovesii TaxID=303347 RepID=A0AAN6NBY8_9PEZI|nr:hypothetical protein QBC46DRAFT_379597 [Diplogelasinospora grovesii]
MAFNTDIAEARAALKLIESNNGRRALATGRPVLKHLNADTTWLIQLPYPASSAAPEGRSHFNILIDPWLQGPQSDVASWFSTQWHVVAPSVKTIAELNTTLGQLEANDGHDAPTPEKGTSYIDAVIISHEFTDHCHRATLEELPAHTPVFATDKAAELIRSWSHFDFVITMPGFSGTDGDGSSWTDVLGDKNGFLPSWLGVGRVVTEGNALFYHSSVVIVFDLQQNGAERQTEAIIYSPHGIKASDLACIKTSGIKTLALLHGLDDVRIWMTAQLNLGALNGIEAVHASGARFWVATHDEAKRGGGLISWLLRRTSYTLRDAVEAEKAKRTDTDGSKSPHYDFVELGSGHALVL